MSAEVTLYTNKMCPFAQKAWIALEEKKAAHGVPFKAEEISLYGAGGKPGWFLKVLDWIDNAIRVCTHARLRPPDGLLTAASRPQMNPRGEVPVLRHGDKVVVESDEIISYIDQALGTPAELSQVRTFRPRAGHARAPWCFAPTHEPRTSPVATPSGVQKRL
jgi:glutathione S-transferase